MKKCIVIITMAVSLLYACKQSSRQNSGVQVIQRDRSVTTANSYSELFLDSIALEKFIGEGGLKDSMANHLRAFYNGRNFEYGWFFKDGLADYATTFLDMHDDYIGYSGDSALYDPSLRQVIDSINTGTGSLTITDSTLLKTELLLTRRFFQYASRAYQGRTQINMRKLEWFIPRKKINVVSVLDSLIQNKGKDVSQYEPVNRQYHLLKNYLLKYYSIEKSGGWPFIHADKNSYKIGDSGQAITKIKKRLFLTVDLPAGDTMPLFNPAMLEAVKSFQHRYGLKENGIVNASLVKEMNRPVGERIRQMLVNMERIRWVPAQPATDYLLVNIPEFRLHAYEKGVYQWSMNIVVGATAHSTVIFTGTLKHVVFSPYWYVPPGIFKNETLPAIRRNKNYLVTHNMEWYGNTVRQKPGPNNSLGLVKFLFPNDYNIYLHDTPAKSLFGEDKRAFSHGCIRLAEPKKLARFLLRNEKSWDSLKIAKAMNASKEQYVNVKEKVPVFIGYFTAWVDREGKLNFRDDIYGHDRRMASHLFAGNQ